jgi:hypothetical protein
VRDRSEKPIVATLRWWKSCSHPSIGSIHAARANLLLLDALARDRPLQRTQCRRHCSAHACCRVRRRRCRVRAPGERTPDNRPVQDTCRCCAAKLREGRKPATPAAARALAGASENVASASSPRARRRVVRDTIGRVFSAFQTCSDLIDKHHP